MPIGINGSGTITGLSAGGLPDGTITQGELATGVAGTGPAFSAWRNGNQSLSNTTTTKVVFNTEDFDTANCFDTTNARFTPNVAGYYQFNACIQIDAGGVDARLIAQLFKNGAASKVGASGGSNSGMYATSSLAVLLYMNGTTDYVECYAYQSSGGTTNIVGDLQLRSHFSASFVRSA